MNVKIEDSWRKALAAEWDKDYFTRLVQFVKHEYATATVFPPGGEIFAAFDATPFDRVKVVIIGQDPYHEQGQAMGLSFSVPKGMQMPPSLINIFKEIHDDLGKPIPTDGDLSRWARQGVLLLNATLTVRAHQANSHQPLGWTAFTDAAIRELNARRCHVVYMLWGGYARSKKTLIDPSRNLILESTHPSPLSANRGGWFGQHQFSRCNAYLKENGEPEIDW
ncbi:MAG: uracil-DNA glycosylase [Prevotella sp.]